MGNEKKKNNQEKEEERIGTREEELQKYIVKLNALIAEYEENLSKVEDERDQLLNEVESLSKGLDTYRQGNSDLQSSKKSFFEC